MFEKINGWLGVRFDGTPRDMARFTLIWMIAGTWLGAVVVWLLIAVSL